MVQEDQTVGRQANRWSDGIRVWCSTVSEAVCLATDRLSEGESLASAVPVKKRSILPTRRYPSTVLAVIVCLSQVGVLLRPLYLGSRTQCHTIAQGLYSFLMPKI